MGLTHIVGLHKNMCPIESWDAGNFTVGVSSTRLEVGFPRLTEDSFWTRSARAAFPSLTITPPSSEAECHCKPRKQSEFFHECRKALRATLRSSDFSQPRRTLYQERVKEVASNPFCERLSLSMIEVLFF